MNDSSSLFRRDLGVNVVHDGFNGQWGLAIGRQGLSGLSQRADAREAEPGFGERRDLPS